jgi:hypothetical protein
MFSSPPQQLNCDESVTFFVGVLCLFERSWRRQRLAGSNMSMDEAMDDAPNTCTAARCSSARDVLILAMLMYGLAQSCEALAADHSADILKNMQPIVGGKPLPMAFVPASRPDEPETSTDFRRRRFAAVDTGSATEFESSHPSQPPQVDSAWQRLADYRSHGRVQLLTLWASPRNMISLQAGKHGGPSLQWSSRVMNRGGATRGLLDRFVASSLGGAASWGSKAAHGSAAAPASKATSSIPATKYP